MNRRRFLTLANNTLGPPAAPARPLLFDDFLGTGALSAHTPNVAPAGASWNVVAGSFANLSGGFLGYVSGNYGRAVIDCGAPDCEIFFRSKYHQANQSLEYGGLLFRSDPTGATYAALTQMYDGTGLRLNFPGTWGGITFDPDHQPDNKTYKYYTAVSGQYYTWHLVLSGTQFRAYDANGLLLHASVNAGLLANTYLGPYLANAVAQSSWDFIRVMPLSTRFRVMAVIGDSISDSLAEWPGLVTARYHQNARLTSKNHALAGATIGDHLSYQVNAAKTDGQDFTIIALGTNDGSTNTTTAYTNALLSLWGAVQKPIYCMGVLPTTTVADSIQNTYIQNAVAAAQAQGVNAAYWNTLAWIDPAADTSDGLHPNAAGQSKIATQILARLP